MPIHNTDTAFWRLLHDPDEPIMLEDVFDNLKHFAICAGLYVLAAHIPESGAWWERGSSMFLVALSLVLGFLCFLQAWVLTQKGFYQFWPVSDHDFRRAPVRANLKLLFLLFIPIVLATAVVVAALTYVHTPKP